MLFLVRYIKSITNTGPLIFFHSMAKMFTVFKEKRWQGNALIAIIYVQQHTFKLICTTFHLPENSLFVPIFTDIHKWQRVPSLDSQEKKTTFQYQIRELLMRDNALVQMTLRFIQARETEILSSKQLEELNESILCSADGSTSISNITIQKDKRKQDKK